MWICIKCGARSEESLVRCQACNATKSKPKRIRIRDFEEALTREQILARERLFRKRRRIALAVVFTFVALGAFLYLFILSSYMGWPRPVRLINWGPSRLLYAVEAQSLRAFAVSRPSFIPLV